MDGFLLVLTVITALGCGLSAGALFAFSSAVMKALARLPPANGVAAMQSINVAVVRSFTFMLALFGTAAACVVLAVWALIDWDESYAFYLLAGSLRTLPVSSERRRAGRPTRHDSRRACAQGRPAERPRADAEVSAPSSSSAIRRSALRSRSNPLRPSSASSSASIPMIVSKAAWSAS